MHNLKKTIVIYRVIFKIIYLHFLIKLIRKLNKQNIHFVHVCVILITPPPSMSKNNKKLETVEENAELDVATYFDFQSGKWDLSSIRGTFLSRNLSLKNTLKYVFTTCSHKYAKHNHRLLRKFPIRKRLVVSIKMHSVLLFQIYKYNWSVNKKLIHCSNTKNTSRLKMFQFKKYINSK